MSAEGTMSVETRAAFDEALRRAGQRIAEDFVKRNAACIDGWQSRFESPIEAVFFAWWKMHAQMGLETFETFALHPQADVEAQDVHYRLDFEVFPSPDSTDPFMSFDDLYATKDTWPRVAVELDGHDFHERTKEQVAHRNRRDRDLQAAGWTVLHFSGSEVVRDPLRCVEEAWDLAYDLFREHAIERGIWCGPGARAAFAVNGIQQR